MAEDVHGDQLTGYAAVAIGKQIIDVVTGGMYSDPLMVLREYVQNACDAIDSAVEERLIASRDGTIEVFVDGRRRTISLLDNGIGVPAADAVRVLCGIGLSPKSSKSSRGFRGVGRLGGLGYCDRLSFETRSHGETTVTSLSWDADRLTACVRQGGELGPHDALGNALVVSRHPAKESDPRHFFRVTMENVRAFHRDVLMDVSRIREYLGEVAPVDFDLRRFPHARKIHEQLSAVDGFRCYSVLVNGRGVLRPHRRDFSLSKSIRDRVSSVQFFDIGDRCGNILGRSWFADTACLAALPSTNRMRGIRLRQGNIQVGGEGFLEDCFSEKRFAAWHVGEIHLNYAVKPNARRDGFEHTPEYEAVLEYCQRLGKHLSQLCRHSSANRTALARFASRIESLDQSMKSPVFVDGHHLRQYISQTQKTLAQLERTLPEPFRKQGTDRTSEVRKRLAEVESSPVFLADRLDSDLLRKMRGDELLRELCLHLANGNGMPSNRGELLKEVIAPFARP